MIGHVDSAIGIILSDLWRASWQATVVAIVVVAIQKILGRRLGGRGEIFAVDDSSAAVDSARFASVENQYFQSGPEMDEVA